MSTIITLISFLVGVLDGAHSPEILDEHPSSLFPTTCRSSARLLLWG